MIGDRAISQANAISASAMASREGQVPPVLARGGQAL
jgi:hypothetical protein